ncbi:MAG: 2-amino-4-hydroxy-6-hydroxymethyldihydropteridine diphosphokinase [Sandaracinaceae bacterium]|nr:2-amino-4-hydroxy-6-hydroxymethyldihydropteridine diphosphokinase [Sandaracinaceae bacterium]
MIVVGLGSNLGSREAFLCAAVRLLEGQAGLVVEARSALYETPPVGPPQPDYLNAAVRLETSLHPREVLPSLLAIEARLGRVRREPWGARTLDLDILYWAGGVVDEPGLRVPHARLSERSFAIAPLLDVAPELAARYACAPLRGRAWASRPDEAVDVLDALALEANARLDPPSRATRVVPFEDELPTEGPGFVVLERWDAEVRRGSRLL